MLKIIRFDRKLLKTFKYNGVEREITGEEILPVVEFYDKLGTVYMGLADDKVIGVGGMFPLWSNSGGCFLFLNKEAQRYKKSVFKCLLEYMRMLIKEYNIKTLSVECMDGVLSAHRLITHLGFFKDCDVKMSRYSKSGE